MNAQQAWQSTLGQLQGEMSKAAFDTWVRSTEVVKHDQDCFTIGVRNAYARDWLESRLASTVTRMLTGIMSVPQQVQFVVWNKDYENETTAAESPVKAEPGAQEEAASLPVNAQCINQRYSFENFMVGSSNRLAHAACMAVAENPAHAYNPLFLYGGVGMGKTHLLHAIGNACTARGLSILYVSSETFTNDLINAIRTHNTAAFRERYRRADVLLIDDIQFIAGKESTQEEFFHTFNALHGADKQIVISSDRPPKAMVTLEERLRSRFEWGLTADIQPPDFETRLAILRSKAERAGRQVPANILELIARNIQSNIRELEGALTRVLAYSDLRSQPLTVEMVNTALVDFLPQRSELEPRAVVAAVANAFGITADKLLSRDRSRDVALPRQVAMYLLREEGNMSLPQIGDVLGGRDHTTVMYAIEKVADLIETEDFLRRQVMQVREQLYGRQPGYAAT